MRAFIYRDIVVGLKFPALYVVSEISDVEHALYRLICGLIDKEHSLPFFDKHRMHWTLWFHVIICIYPRAKRLQIRFSSFKRVTLLVDPQRCHHRRMSLLLRRLLLVDGAFPVGVVGSDGEPSSRLRKNSQYSILSSKFFWRWMIL